MREAFSELLEKADFAVASCREVMSPEDLEPLVRDVANVRTRLSYPEEVLVAALAGGTGSGKSSLLNAVAGSAVAHVGGKRPTTETPLALVPAGTAGAVEGYLDRLEIMERAQFDNDWLCLIDLPDSDSVVVEHRLTVQALLPRLDVVVWVVDPEKYRAAELHSRYLRPLSPYSGQFLFVLNQVDRLDPDSAAAVAADLEDALAEDGFRSATIILTSADPPSGPPIGVEELITALGGIARSRAGIYAKLLVDLEEASRKLADLTGSVAPRFDEGADSTVDSAVEAILGGQADRATEELSGFLDSVAAQAGGLPGSRIRTIAAGMPAHVQRAVDQMESAAGSKRGRRRWPFSLLSRGASGEVSALKDPVREELMEAVVRPVRAVLAQRAAANAALADLTLSVLSHRGPDS